MRPPRPAAAAALLGSAVLVAGCSSAVAGSASPAAVGPFTEVLAEFALAVVHEQLAFYDVEAAPDGTFVAFLTGRPGTANRHGSALVELVPGEDGFTVGRVTEGAPYAIEGGEVHVAADGTVVAVGSVLAGYEDDGETGDEEQYDLVLTVLPPGAEEAEVVPVGADIHFGPPDDATGVLSADGGTYYASVRWETGDDSYVSHLAAIDVATGELLANVQSPVDTTGVAVTFELGLLPDGNVAALVQNTRDDTGDESGVQLAVLDPRMRLVGEPVDVVPDEPYVYGYAMEVLPDGTALFAVAVGQEDGDARLVTVRDGQVQASTAIPGNARDVVVDAAGRTAYLDLDRPEGGVAVASVDLVTGEVLADVVLCDEIGTATDIALTRDDTALAAGGACPGADSADPLFLLG